MHPVHDVDALLLLAVALSAKRRPAELVEIMAAIELIHGAIPAEQKLLEAFSRLAAQGLLHETAGAIALTLPAQALAADRPRKGDYAEWLFTLKANLAASLPLKPAVDSSDGLPGSMALSLGQIAAAVLAHRNNAKEAGRNLLVPKPKPAEDGKSRPGQRQRKPAPKSRRGSRP